VDIMSQKASVSEHPPQFAQSAGRYVSLRGAAVLCFTLLTTPLINGCGKSTDGRVAVSGEVTLDGQPLDRGTIEFHPKSAGGTMTGGMISNGTFTIAADQGPKPGSYEVRVFAAGAGTTVDPNEPPGPESQAKPPAERIPARFNVKSELTAEVGPDGDAGMKFALESK
jgi:hypothetical protein